MKPPSVSVVIPAHNRSDLLARAVESVLAQTHDSFELIVVDDGSTEDLMVVAERVRNAGHTFLSQLNQGVASARNRGVEMAQGEWLAFLDSDDYWLPEKLAHQLANMGAHDISQTAEAWIRKGRSVAQGVRYQHASGDVFAQCLEVCCISCSSVVLRKSLFERTDGFDERYPVCEDYALWIRLARRHAVGWLPEALTVKHAGHADQLSTARPAMDRFRVHALLALWLDKETSSDQRVAIAQKIGLKSQRLYDGARKRGLHSAELYQSCLQWVDQAQHDSARVLLGALEDHWRCDRT